MMTANQITKKIKDNSTTRRILFFAWLLITGLMYFRTIFKDLYTFIYVALGSISTLILILSLTIINRIEELTLEVRQSEEARHLVDEIEETARLQNIK